MCVCACLDSMAWKAHSDCGHMSLLLENKWKKSGDKWKKMRNWSLFARQPPALIHDHQCNFGVGSGSLIPDTAGQKTLTVSLKSDTSAPVRVLPGIQKLHSFHQQSAN